MTISLYLVIDFDIWMHILNIPWNKPVDIVDIATKSGLLDKIGISNDFGC